MLSIKRFNLDMTRQLTFYDGDENDGMKALHCTFEYEPVDALRALGERSLWSFGAARRILRPGPCPARLRRC